MVSLHQTQRQCQALALQAIEEMAPILLEEGGVEELLKALAMLVNGKVLPAPLVARLEEQAAKIRSA